MSSKLIVALDTDNLERAEELIDTLSPVVDIFKVGFAPHLNFGQPLLDKLTGLGKKIFLDLKLHDIPNTIKNATQAIARQNVFMTNFHCFGGLQMLRAAVEGARSIDVSRRMILLGVTVLTSMSPDDLENINVYETVPDQVLTLAKLAEMAGLDGVVASAQEATMIKKKIRDDFVVVTPGIRPDWFGSADDQKRVLTPKDALDAGADYLVVGRPIIGADDPLRAAQRILDEMGEVS